MSYDKSWTFTLNQTPAVQDTLQHQAQSFMGFLQSSLITAGWSQIVSSGLGSFPVAVTGHTSTVLSDGRILVIGGHDGVNYLANTYFGTVSGNTVTWVAGTALPTACNSHASILLADGRILVTGGTTTAGAAQAVTYFGTISGNTITWVSGTALPLVLYGHTLNQISDGRILIAGGVSNTAVQTSATWGTISGNTITWAVGSALPTYTALHTMTTLADGRLLLAGGSTGAVIMANTYFGTINGTAINWAAGTAIPLSLNLHTATQLSDGRILITGGTTSGGTIQSVTYFGTISANTITWVSGTALLAAMQQQTLVIISDGRAVIIGGANTLGRFPSVTFATISTNTLTWVSMVVNLNYAAWNTNTNPRTWALFASPAGIVPGPDGSFTNSQSQVYLCIECVGTSTTDYSKYNLTFYSVMPNAGTVTAIPTGGNAQSIAAAGTQFVNTALTATKFHFATTPAGGFFAGISYPTTGIMSTLLGFFDVTDVQKYGSGLYPYPVLGFSYYNYATGNMTYNLFDSVGNTAGVKCFNGDGTAGTPRALVWCNPNSGVVIAGSGTTQTGDINGNILDSHIYLYNAASGKVAMIGRIPDFKAIGSTGTTNGGTDNVTPTFSFINQLLIPSNVAIAT